MIKPIDFRNVGQRALLLLSALLGLAALGAPLTAPAEAALDGCRSDPIIYLSDGTALDLSADIGVSVSNVTAIDYVIHVPAGLKVLLVVTTPTLGFQGKETVAVVADAPAKQYSTDTFVQTQAAGVGVTSDTTLVGVYLSSLSLSLQAKPASGLNGQHLITTLVR